MSRKYWLDLFTGKSWEEFLTNGANVSGFRESNRKMAEKVKVGDYLICYVTGVSRFIGILEVKSALYTDETPIWSDDIYPCRFKVALIHKLDPMVAIPVQKLRDKLSIFQNLKSEKVWTGFFRRSFTEFKNNDAEVILNAIQNALKTPEEIPYDEKKYWCQPKTYESKDGTVTIPEEEKDLTTEESKLTHEDIQGLLLELGSSLGLDVWVARNDKNRKFNDTSFQNIPNLLNKLPVQFDEATNRTIELIDVLWLQGDAIIAAFEIEHTTAIYSGLLRMSDLISMQPNIKINLYLVAPDERREKVISEINRPTFAKLKTPLSKTCKFIAYSELTKKAEQAKPFIKHLKPEFIDEIAESCETN